MAKLMSGSDLVSAYAISTGTVWRHESMVGMENVCVIGIALILVILLWWFVGPVDERKGTKHAQRVSLSLEYVLITVCRCVSNAH